MSVAEEIEGRAAPVLTEAGLELVAVQYQREAAGWVLRFFIDKEGGISLDDCTEWSHRLEQLVDESGLVTNKYVLEVSSPGLARPLRKKQDFERFAGLEAFVKTHEPIGNQRNFHGILKGVLNDELQMLDRTNGLVKIPLAAVANAKLDPPINLNDEAKD